MGYFRFVCNVLGDGTMSERMVTWPACEANGPSWRSRAWVSALKHDAMRL